MGGSTWSMIFNLLSPKFMRKFYFEFIFFNLNLKFKSFRAQNLWAHLKLTYEGVSKRFNSIIVDLDQLCILELWFELLKTAWVNDTILESVELFGVRFTTNVGGLPCQASSNHLTFGCRGCVSGTARSNNEANLRREQCTNQEGEVVDLCTSIKATKHKLKINTLSLKALTYEANKSRNWEHLEGGE